MDSFCLAEPLPTSRLAMTDAVGKVEVLAAERDRRRSKPWPVFTMAEVASHCYSDDAWIVVSDKALLFAYSSGTACALHSHHTRTTRVAQVYDMTAHVQHHEGWVGSGKVSTLLALLSAMGTDCSLDFNSTHDARGFRELHVRSPRCESPISVFRLAALSCVQICRWQ